MAWPSAARRSDWLRLPNLITGLRFALLPVFAIMILTGALRWGRNPPAASWLGTARTALLLISFPLVLGQAWQLAEVATTGLILLVVGAVGTPCGHRPLRVHDRPEP